MHFKVILWFYKIKEKYICEAKTIYEIMTSCMRFEKYISREENDFLI